MISLFSCSPDQYSYELEAIEQGAFTYALLEGLGIRGRCATVERLNQYLEHRVPELVSQHLQSARQIPYTIAEPLNRSHLILMPQYASLADVATLKNDAYRAERKQDWDVAQQLWIRVNAAASGQDIEAIEALQQIGIQRHIRVLPPQLQPPHVREISESSKAPDLSEPVPSILNAIDAVPLESEKDVDYRNLRDLLKAEKWHEADVETLKVMLKATDLENQGWLDETSLENFPCKDLQTIDRLWITASSGHFGFSIQKKIWSECGSPREYNDEWEKFGYRVGWWKGGNWLTYDNLKLIISLSPAGELPRMVVWAGRGCGNEFLTSLASLPYSLFSRKDLPNTCEVLKTSQV